MLHWLDTKVAATVHARSPVGQWLSSADEGENVSTTVKRPFPLRFLRALIILTLLILTAQGWFGGVIDTVFTTSTGSAPSTFSLTSFLHALQTLQALSLNGYLRILQSLQAPFFFLWHTFAGLVLLILGIFICLFSFIWTKIRGARIWSVIGLLAILAAIWGGFHAIQSGFVNGPTLAHTGGSFIIAYASYFFTLYYTK